jgi:hypothetical protein
MRKIALQEIEMHPIAIQIVIGTEQFIENPARPSTACKAPEGWRSPRRFAYFRNRRVAHCVLECGGPPPLFLEPY